MRRKFIVVLGARPQFIKHAALYNQLNNAFDTVVINTGQHYDDNMSQIFFKDLNIPSVDYQLHIGSESHAIQTANMMVELDKIFDTECPDGVIVYGDTNTTLAAALVASKKDITIAHVEAGLRSYNNSMPEELNRVLTDKLSSLLFVPSVTAKSNLNKEGIFDNVYVVGDIMKDLVLSVDINKKEQEYIYVSLHRPYNVDDRNRLQYVLESVNKIATPVLFTLHPRTANNMNAFGINKGNFANINFLEPQSYTDNINYIANANVLITDSGGMQKEAYWLKTKCITIRPETEWVETLSDDANVLMYEDLSQIGQKLEAAPSWIDDLYGEGNASSKIVNVLKDYFCNGE